MVKPVAWMDDIKLVTVYINSFIPKLDNSFPLIFQKKNKIPFQITQMTNLNEHVYQIYLSEENYFLNLDEIRSYKELSRANTYDEVSYKSIFER